MAKNGGLHRIGDLAPAEQHGEFTYGAEQILNQDLVLTDYFEVAGQFSPYMEMICQRGVNGQTIHVTSGSKILMEQLRALNPNEVLPATIRFVQIGKNIVIR